MFYEQTDGIKGFHKEFVKERELKFLEEASGDIEGGKCSVFTLVEF